MLTFPAPPASALDAAVGVASNRTLAAQPGLTPLPPGGIRLSVEMLVASFADVQQAPPQLRSHSAGWKHLLAGRAEAVVVHGTGLARQYQFAAVEAGPHLAAMDAALAYLSTLTELRDEDYEVVLLQVPSVYVLALWLRTAGRTADRFWVLPPAHYLVPSARLLSEAEFSEAFARAVDDMVLNHIPR